MNASLLILLFDALFFPTSISLIQFFIKDFFSNAHSKDSIDIVVAPFDDSCKVRVIKTTCKGGVVSSYDIEIVESDTIFGFPQSVRKE